MFLNIHSHRALEQLNYGEIGNVIVPAEAIELQELRLDGETKKWLSAGIHPWYINEKWIDLQMDTLNQIAENDSVKLIGECGLDRLRGVNLELQTEVFIKQIAIAEKLKKPMIIHCVRCFNELLTIKNTIRPQVPMIVHGFNQNQQLAEQLLKKGFYLSFGTAILHPNSNAAKFLKHVPKDKLFLETDDKDVAIEKIYLAATEILTISLENLQAIIYENFLRLY